MLIDGSKLFRDLDIFHRSLKHMISTKILGDKFELHLKELKLSEEEKKY